MRASALAQDLADGVRIRAAAYDPAALTPAERDERHRTRQRLAHVLARSHKFVAPSDKQLPGAAP